MSYLLEHQQSLLASVEVLGRLVSDEVAWVDVVKVFDYVPDVVDVWVGRDVL